ncbi:amidohydrolase family protein [Burkholderia multivorans]|uniref:Amidohydrolase family protein n=1 Tax=Burkholderia multivorans TaxID=87883 RepID=A0AAP2HH99_9BURK|nr:amidohydrolase family protein [Burkholderia multivorans]MBU9356128.1 amidohydrolase family protein [Burkholderia multivorans]MBU9366484.1 amidohydrolase family protein [Burkholderia multivorans]MBU9597098.1 amidohydrolase family protein [Burkholderia multivorans]MCA8488064.1 amidohydrolase family protein [Burkholderia multivorans]
MPDDSIHAVLNAHPTVRHGWLALRSEDILDPELPIVDPHHHLWDHPGDRYLANEAIRDLSSGHNITSTVHVQCRSMYRKYGPESLKPVGETEFVRQLAAATNTEQAPLQLCAGIIGTVDVELGDGVQSALDAHIDAGGGRFRGIRPTVVCHESRDILPVSNPEGLLRAKSTRAAIARIQKMGLTLDLWTFFTQLDDVADLCRDYPDLTVIINHTGGPLGIGPYKDKRAEVFEAWRARVQALAALPNTVMKLGGLAMRYAGFGFHERTLPPSSDELVHAWAPYMRFCIELFGTERCMFESNFPVDKATCSYSVLWNAYKKIAADLTATERMNLFSGTAARTYRLHPPQALRLS